mgnify:CR=1 FL=1
MPPDTQKPQTPDLEQKVWDGPPVQPVDTQSLSLDDDGAESLASVNAAFSPPPKPANIRASGPTPNEVVANRVIHQVTKFGQDLPKTLGETAVYEHKFTHHPLEYKHGQTLPEGVSIPSHWPGIMTESTNMMDLAKRIHEGGADWEDLYRSYKHSPHLSGSYLLKYLTHRINNLDAYEDHARAHELDNQFKQLHQFGGAKDKNGHVSMEHLHGWVKKNGAGLIQELMDQRDKVQRMLSRGVGLKVRDIHGQPHVALTRGLSSELMTHEHALSSWADLKDTGFGTTMHRAWVPLKDVWYSYNLGPKGPTGSMGHENEWLVSHTAPRYEATSDDVSRLHDGFRQQEFWKDPEVDAPFLFDDISDADLAKVVVDRGEFGFAQDAIKLKNAGPLTLAAVKQVNGGWLAIRSLSNKAVPREEIQEKLGAGGSSFSDPNVKAQVDMETLGWAATNPNLTRQDLEYFLPFLDKDYGPRHLLKPLINHPQADSELLEKIHDQFKARGWDLRGGEEYLHHLYPHHLTTPRMITELLDQFPTKWANGSPRGLSNNLFAELPAAPAFTSEHTKKMIEKHNGDDPGVYVRAPFDDKHFDDFVENQWAGHISQAVIGNPRLTEQQLHKVWDHAQKKYDGNSGALVDAAADFKRRHFETQPLPASLQLRLAQDAPNELASSVAKGLAPEALKVLAVHPANWRYIEQLGMNSKVKLGDLEAAWPITNRTPEEYLAGKPPGENNPTTRLAEVIVKRKAFEARKAKEHLIKSFPVDLYKSEDDFFDFELRDWLNLQGKPEEYLHPHTATWWEGSTHHYGQPEDFGLAKSELPAHDLIDGYGNVLHGKRTVLQHVDYRDHEAKIDELAANHGYEFYTGDTDHANRNFNTGHIYIHPANSSTLKAEAYTRSYRKLHELAHALTLEDVNSIYGEGKRLGRLGHDRSLMEAKRAVHWEYLAMHRQRELADSFGHFMPDEDFHKELNTVLHDAMYRVVTGRIHQSEDEGFDPHTHKVPLEHSLMALDRIGAQMGLQHQHDTYPKAVVNKAEALEKARSFYHGTPHEFDRFEQRPGNASFFGGLVSIEVPRVGFFFARSRKFAAGYAGPTGRVIQANLNLGRTLHLHNRPGHNQFQSISAAMEEMRPHFDAQGLPGGFAGRYIPGNGWSMKPWQLFDGEHGPKVVAALKSAGYNSVSFHEEDPDTGKSYQTHVVFDPEQITQLGVNKSEPLDLDSDFLGLADSLYATLCQREQEEFLEKMAVLDQTQNPSFQEWFGGSKATDPGGKPLKVFHGSTHAFSSFGSHKGNPDNWYGRAHYFTNSPIDASQNYARVGPDLKNRLETERDRSSYSDEPEDFKAIKQRLVGHNRNVTPVYLSMKNPVVVQPKGGTRFSIEQEFDEQGDPVGEEKGNGMDVYHAIHRLAPAYGVDADHVWGEVSGDASFYDGVTAHEIEQKLRGSDHLLEARDPASGEIATNEFIRDLWRELGHDGVIMDANAQFGKRPVKAGFGQKFMTQGMTGVKPGTKHYIVFEPHQIKSIFNRTFDPKDPAFGKSEGMAFDLLLNDPGLDEIDHDNALEQLGHDSEAVAALQAAKFLSGKEPDTEKYQMALIIHEGDIQRAALYACGLNDSKANLKALDGALKLGEFSKSEPEAPQIKSVLPAVPEAADTAEQVRRAVQAGFVYPIKLSGKHSKGTVVVRDPKSGGLWLLKPGSGALSPAKGVVDESASQSAREAAFWYVADSVGLGGVISHTDLLAIDADQVAAIKYLPTQFKSLDKLNRKDPGTAQKILEPYRANGQIFRWAILEYVLGSSDSHGANILSDGNSIALIDHGSSFSGEGFSVLDTKTFAPYYLRMWSPKKFTTLPPDKKLEAMPTLNAEQEEVLRLWVESIDENELSHILGHYGITPGPSLRRLEKIRSMDGPFWQRINKLWAGVE